LTPLPFRNLPSIWRGRDRSTPYTRVLENNAMLYISCQWKGTEELCRLDYFTPIWEQRHNASIVGGV